MAGVVARIKTGVVPADQIGNSTAARWEAATETLRFNVLLPMPSTRSKPDSLAPAWRAASPQSTALFTAPEPPFDDVVLLASVLCETSAAAIFLLDHGRPWSKAQIGIDYLRCPRTQAICDAAMANPTQLLVIDDVAQDARFATTLVRLGQPPLRFFAGMPLLSPDRYPLGILCVMDVAPRRLSTLQRAGLEALARQTHHLFELRRYCVEQQRLLSEREAITQRLEQARAELEQRRRAITPVVSYEQL